MPRSFIFRADHVLRRWLAAGCLMILVLQRRAAGEDGPPFKILPLPELTRAKAASGERLALAAADLDEDGVPDLICGWGSGTGGTVTVDPGDKDAIYPNAPAAKARRAKAQAEPPPFHAGKKSCAVAAPADFVAAGDFDADGHWDVVAAARGGAALYWFKGDGTGNLLPAQEIKLPGAVTAFAAGEVNRRDGLTDLIVGIAAKTGPAALVYEGPEGALRGSPEVLPLNEEVRAIALGPVGGGGMQDIVLGGASGVDIVFGRDRQLTLPPARQKEVPAPAIAHVATPSPVAALTVASLVDDPGHDRQAGVLCASGELFALQAPGRNAAGWGLQPLAALGPGDFAALTPARLPGSARATLLAVNKTTGELKLLGAGGKTGQFRALSKSSNLPTARAVLPMRLTPDGMDDLVTIQPASAGIAVALTAPSVILRVNDTADTDSRDTSLTLREAVLLANRTLANDELTTYERALIGGAPPTGPIPADAVVAINFSLPIATPHTIWLGSVLPKIVYPVVIDGTTQPDFQGTPVVELTAGSPDVYVGIRFDTGDYHRSDSSNSVVRGLAINNFYSLDAGSVYGVGIETDFTDVVIFEGNIIGTDPTGTLARPNGTGINSGVGQNNIIGGTVPEARNLISGNATGIACNTGDLIQGNTIGADVTGLHPLPNTTYGVYLDYGCTVGGTTAGSGNLISGNAYGIAGLAPQVCLVQGNFIGVDKTGLAAIGNGTGLFFYFGGDRNTIGGTTPAARNVIAGNGTGFYYYGAQYNIPVQYTLFEGNTVGVNAAGQPLGNSGRGITSYTSGWGPCHNTIGGATTGAGNVIACNGAGGIVLNEEGSGVIGNWIHDNKGDGVFVGGVENQISANSIYNNKSDGVFAGDAFSTNTVLSNIIHDNGGLGINLGVGGHFGVAANDPGDLDGIPNYPVITGLIKNGSTTVTAIVTHLDTTTTKTLVYVEFFANTKADLTGYGEGEIFLGAKAVTTDAQGHLDFTFTLPVKQPAALHFTATATNPAGGTSEFSANYPAVTGYPTTGQIVRYLLGIDTDPFGLNLNGDAKIDAADVIFNVKAGR